MSTEALSVKGRPTMSTTLETIYDMTDEKISTAWVATMICRATSSP